MLRKPRRQRHHPLMPPARRCRPASRLARCRTRAAAAGGDGDRRRTVRAPHRRAWPRRHRTTTPHRQPPTDRGRRRGRRPTASRRQRQHRLRRRRQREPGRSGRSCGCATAAGGGAGRMACCRARAKTPPWRMASRRVRRPPVARPAKPLPAPLPRCRPAAAAFARRAGDAGMRRWPARRSPGRPHPRPMPPHPPVPRSRAGPKKIGRLGRGVGVARSPRPRARRLAAASTIRRNRVDRSGQRRREARATAAPPGRKRLGRTRGSARGHRATGGATAVIGATGRGGMRRAAAGAMRRARSSANSIRLIRWLIAALRMSRRIAAHGGCIGRSSSGRPPTR